MRPGASPNASACSVGPCKRDLVWSATSAASPTTASPTRRGTASEMCIPLCAGAELWGVLDMQDPSMTPSTRRRGFARTVANQMGRRCTRRPPRAGRGARTSRARTSSPPTLRRMRRILIVGSTGSIGTQALDVVSRSDSLEVVGLAAGGNADLLLEQAAPSSAWTPSPWPTPTRRPAPPRLDRRAACWAGRGPGRADHRLRRRPGAERPGGLRRPGADRGRAGRGHRAGPGQQGEPGGGRRPGHGPGRGHRHPHPARGLRALGAVPAPGRRGARRGRLAPADRLRRPVPRPHRPRGHHAWPTPWPTRPGTSGGKVTVELAPR